MRLAIRFAFSARFLGLARPLLVLAGLALLGPRSAAQFEQDWLTTFSSRGTKDVFVLGHDIAPNGTTWVAAMRTLTDPLDPLSIIGPKSLLLLRLDADGKVEWLHEQPQLPRYSHNNVPGGVRVDAEGFAYVAFRVGNVSRVAKYSPLGTELWRRPLDMHWGPYMNAPMAVDDEGGILVAGTVPQKGPGGTDPKLVRLAPDGSLSWQVVVPGIGVGLSLATHVEVDPAGRVHLAAWSAKTYFGIDSFALRFAFDRNGDLLWSSEFDAGVGKGVWPMAIEIQPDGGSTTSIRISSKDNGEWTNEAVALMHLGPSGERLWTTMDPIAPHFDKICTGMSTSPNGQLIVSGLTYDYALSTGNLLTRAFVESYSDQGAKLWAGGSSADCTRTRFEGPAMFDDQGRIVLVGTISGGAACGALGFGLELFSEQGQWLGSSQEIVPGGYPVFRASGLMDEAGTIRVVGEAHLASIWQGAMVFAAGYKLP